MKTSQKTAVTLALFTVMIGTSLILATTIVGLAHALPGFNLTGSAPLYGAIATALIGFVTDTYRTTIFSTYPRSAPFMRYARAGHPSLLRYTALLGHALMLPALVAGLHAATNDAPGVSLLAVVLASTHLVITLAVGLVTFNLHRRALRAA